MSYTPTFPAATTPKEAKVYAKEAVALGLPANGVGRVVTLDRTMYKVLGLSGGDVLVLSEEGQVFFYAPDRVAAALGSK